MAPKFRFDHPDRALDALAEKLATVQEVERSKNLVGRVLASAVVADRDSPAADVSAMDGYAIRLSELQTTKSIVVTGESSPGGPPPILEPNSAIRIFTGAIVPTDADLVIKREDTEESELRIQLRESAMQCQAGEHIRRTGENATAGSVVLNPGIRLTAAHRATMANFGSDEADVYTPVTISIITTGDEVGVKAGTTPQPWQLRDSNRASLSAMLDLIPWTKLHAIDHAEDQQATLRNVLENHLGKSDAVLLTGGVSMGNYDYVPDVIRDLGGEIVFHGLPIRPGKPVLGAATKDGKLIIGLPGNPVSATVGCRRLALPLLAKISGQIDWNPPCPVVGLKNPGDKTIPLHWLKLVRLSDAGLAEIVISQGSGDLVSLGKSSGFVEVTSGQAGQGPWPYYSWEI